MDLEGKVINNCYSVLSKQYTDPLFEYWEAKSFYSTESFILQFFRTEGKPVSPEAQERITDLFLKTLPIENPNLHTPIEVEEFEGQTFFAYPAEKGCSLDEFLLNIERLPLPHIISIAFQIMNGLIALKAHGLAHNCLTPRNIWVDSASTDSIRIRLDNLYASLLWDEGQAGKDIRRGIDIRYLAPEYKSYTALSGYWKNDLFSLAWILYRLMYGDLPDGTEGVSRGQLEARFAESEIRDAGYAELNDLILTLIYNPEAVSDLRRVIEILRGIEVSTISGLDVQKKLESVRDRYRVQMRPSSAEHAGEELVIEELASVTVSEDEILKDEHAPAIEPDPEYREGGKKKAHSRVGNFLRGLGRVAAKITSSVARMARQVLTKILSPIGFALRTYEDYQTRNRAQNGGDVTGDMKFKNEDTELRTRRVIEGLEQHYRRDRGDGRESGRTVPSEMTLPHEAGDSRASGFDYSERKGYVRGGYAQRTEQTAENTHPNSEREGDGLRELSEERPYKSSDYDPKQYFRPGEKADPGSRGSAEPTFPSTRDYAGGSQSDKDLSSGTGKRGQGSQESYRQWDRGRSGEDYSRGYSGAETKGGAHDSDAPTSPPAEDEELVPETVKIPMPPATREALRKKWRSLSRWQRLLRFIRRLLRLG
jgi:serine/threonine protein kinase